MSGTPMDDLSFLVDETYRLTELRVLGELEDGEETWEPSPVPAALAPTSLAPLFPAAPGILYVVEKNGGTFVVRTFATGDAQKTQAQIRSAPEDFPSLKLVDQARLRLEELRFFECDSEAAARALADRLGHRRLPVDEEALCNLSDPGFSWWLETQAEGFVLHAKLHSLDEKLLRLGPVTGEAEEVSYWGRLARTLGGFPLGIEVRVETGRFCFKSPAHPFVAEAFLQVYREGVIGEELSDLFKLFAKKPQLHSDLEALWAHLTDVASTRRFWQAIQTRLAELPSY